MNILQTTYPNKHRLYFYLILFALASMAFQQHKILPIIQTPKVQTFQAPDTTQWTELIRLDPTIALDIRYATTNNFVGTKMYTCGKCYLKPAVAKSLLKVHQALRKKGMGLKMYDCYRPLSVQWALWKKVPDARYVADPRKGSMHNRGSAVDLTIVDRNGNELDMGTTYDYFGIEAYTDNKNLPAKVLANRKILQDLMLANDFRMTRTEWWHFSYTRASYPISDMTWSCP